MPLVVVGRMDCIRGWLDLAGRSPRFHLVGVVPDIDDADVSGEGVAVFASIETAIEQSSDAVFAVTLPPRALLDAALTLARANRAAVLRGPLPGTLTKATLTDMTRTVRVAYGWITLPGLLRIQPLLAQTSGGTLSVEIAGTPDGPSTDFEEMLEQGAALLNSLLPGITVDDLHIDTEERLRLSLSRDEWHVDVSIRCGKPSLSVIVETNGQKAAWTFDAGQETVQLPGAKTLHRRPPPADIRALAQLLPQGSRGSDLADAVAAQHLVRCCLERLPSRLPPGDAVFREAMARGRQRPEDPLVRLGLEGTLPQSDRKSLHLLDLDLSGNPLELWAFRAGLKPVVFLTVRPEEEERTRSLFGDVYCERRERRVTVGAQDRWEDHRDRGSERVELYLGRDPEQVRRAVYLQSEVDPSAALRELGVLVGYPTCCVDAFARQDDRANNSRNRYFTWARTVRPDGSTVYPWPWELNNLHTMLVPFYPCSYHCEAALAWARAVIVEMQRSNPLLPQQAKAALARPVLYFDHDHQMSFEGNATAGGVEYRQVYLPRRLSSAFERLASAIALGNRLLLDDETLTVETEGQCILRLRRVDPCLGFLAPFSSQMDGATPGFQSIGTP